MARYLLHPALKKALWLLLPFLFIMAHPFFVEVTEIKHNPKTKTLEITCKMFTADLERALHKETGNKLDLLHPADKKLADTALYNYIKKRFSVSVNGKPAPYSFIGYEKDEDCILTYLETVQVDQPLKMEIITRLLYEIIDQQINIVHAEVGAVKHSYKVSHPEHEVRFEFGK